MKIREFLRTVVNGFGEVDILLTVWTSTDAQSKSLLKFSNIFCFCYTASNIFILICTFIMGTLEL